MAGTLTVAQLTAELPDGIDIDAAAYPPASNALKLVADFNQAVIAAQTVQNAAAPAGEDVSLVTYQVGATTTITRDDVVHTVRPATYQLTVFEKVVVDDVLPVLV